MRRVFWVAVGAAAGVYAVRKVQKTMHAYSPSGLAEKAGGLGESLKAFAEEVRERAAEREADLRDALGLTEDSVLSPAEAAELTDHPARRRTSTASSATAATDSRSTR